MDDERRMSAEERRAWVDELVPSGWWRSDSPERVLELLDQMAAYMGEERAMDFIERIVPLVRAEYGE